MLGLRDFIKKNALDILEKSILPNKAEIIHTEESKDSVIPPVPITPPGPPKQFRYDDAFFPYVVDTILSEQSCSHSILQRRLKIGYLRASKFIGQMEEMGIVGPYEPSGIRQVLISSSNWDDALKELNIEAKQKVNIDEEQIIKDEQKWIQEQRGLSPVDEELYQIDHMSGSEFELWCADLLRDNGFSNVEVTQASNDQGVDVLAEKSGIKYAVQCKCYSSDLGNTPVQEVNTGKYIYRCHVGAVMTNRYFTSGAKEAAEATGTLLWDRDTISDMLKGYAQ